MDHPEKKCPKCRSGWLSEIPVMEKQDIEMVMACDECKHTEPVEN